MPDLHLIDLKCVVLRVVVLSLQDLVNPYHLLPVARAHGSSEVLMREEELSVQAHIVCSF